MGNKSIAQEVSFHNRDGEAVAYLSQGKDALIYLWNGKLVAHLEKEGNIAVIYSIAGRFLGWYRDAIVYDRKGYRVGSKNGILTINEKQEAGKGLKQITPANIGGLNELLPLQPIWKDSWSSTSLQELLNPQL